MLLLCFIFLAFKALAGENLVQHPLYIGALGGFGSTTWDWLVPDIENQNEALAISTPIAVREGGGVFGVFVGYEFSSHFALEASYLRYPRATILFDDEMSLFSFDHDGLAIFSSDTSLVNAMGKVMVFIPNTSIKFFSSAGAALLHRNDVLRDRKRITPTFGLGLNYDVTPHVMGEIAGNYTAGYAESNMNPSETYFPFLFSLVFRLAYRF